MNRARRFFILALAALSLGFVTVQATHAAGERDGASAAPLAISG